MKTARKAETALGAAFKRAGVSEWKNKFREAVTFAENSGASYAEIRVYLLLLVEDLPDDGPDVGAAGGHQIPASVRQPQKDDVGRSISAKAAIPVVPTSSPPDRGGRGQLAGALVGPILTAPPVREPSRHELGAAAHVARRRAEVFTLTFSDKWRIFNEKPVKQVTYFELRHYANMGSVHGKLAELLIARNPYDTPDFLRKTVGQVEQNDAELEALIRDCEKRYRYVPPAQ